MTAPDWPELRRIGAEATRLADATHRLLPGDYERLLARAKVAVARLARAYPGARSPATGR